MDADQRLTVLLGTTIAAVAVPAITDRVPPALRRSVTLVLAGGVLTLVALFVAPAAAARYRGLRAAERFLVAELHADVEGL